MTTNYIAGLSSGFDWSSMISQLMEVERQPEQLLETRKSTLNDKYKAWSDVNTKLLALKTAAQSLSDIDDFNVYTSSTSITGTSGDVEDFASFAVGSNATQGSYTLKINNLAQAQKLSTRSFSSKSSALSLSGDLVINGRAVSISTSDNLSDIQGKINALNSGTNASGVTASIITVGANEYRLTLTSKTTGADGFNLANGSTDDLLGELGLADDTFSVANAISNGAQSILFKDTSSSIKTLLGLNSAATGTVQIGGVGVAIDLSTQSLQDISDTINQEMQDHSVTGVSSSIVTETVSGTTYYRLQIDGYQPTGSDENNNVLNTLGILKRGYSDVSGFTGSVANTADGQVITGDTLIASIDGYNTFTAGDYINISGSRHGGGVVDTNFTITSTSTVNDLLDAIKEAYKAVGGSDEVNAYVSGDGKIVVEDNLSGASSLSIELTDHLTASGTSEIDFGTFNPSTIRKRQITAGEDAQITLDGATIKKSSNKITDVIQGVTISLLKEDAGAEITLDITRDTSTIKKNISSFVSSYNAIMDYINQQFTYTNKDSDSNSSVTTPALFADSSLMTVRSTLRNVITSSITGVDSSFNKLSLFGMTLDKTGKLTIDDTKLDGYLETNFNDIVNLFSVQGSSTNSDLTYLSSTEETKEGSYEVMIDQYATKANETGAGFSGSLSADATVTITDDKGQVATIALSQNWGISSIVNAINSELSQSYKQTLVGENSYYADNLQNNVITADTTLDSLYDGSGTSAGLADGDEIHFSGLDHRGVVIDDTFDITDASTQTVGDFLTYIEEKFGSGYTASIDSSGRITIQDPTTGDSSLSLTIDPVAGRNLDFGTIDADPLGADGSHTGRLAMDVIAENAGGQLSISNKSYGSADLTISVSGGNLGITNGTYSGQDVEGKIRKSGTSIWTTMTGSGITLTVDADDEDTSGLSISYAGNSTGTFDFTFTTGIGSKLDNSLFYMTDSTSGYISSKEESLQSQMDAIDKKIEDMEARIARRQEQLIAQYTAMEKLISQLTTQQSQLSSQISGLNNSK